MTDQALTLLAAISNELEMSPPIILKRMREVFLVAVKGGRKTVHEEILRITTIKVIMAVIKDYDFVEKIGSQVRDERFVSLK